MGDVWRSSSKRGRTSSGCTRPRSRLVEIPSMRTAADLGGSFVNQSHQRVELIVDYSVKGKLNLRFAHITAFLLELVEGVVEELHEARLGLIKALGPLTSVDSLVELDFSPALRTLAPVV
ncbi:hypothetical protein HG530_003821 [Fusarium avenaceum]|nr:hypothetical protein HG530_003821 [Fusarium avenaceum]